MNLQTPVALFGGDPTKRFGELWKEQINSLRESFETGIILVSMPQDAMTDVPILVVTRSVYVAVIEHLKKKGGYTFLADLTAVDEGFETPEKPRFDVVVHLFAQTNKARIRIKCPLRDQEEIPTLTSLWKGANWLEREVYDLFGIRFTGHPDLRRILLDQRWKGHPLRKDYPIKGSQQLFPDAQPIEPDLLMITPKGDSHVIPSSF